MNTYGFHTIHGRAPTIASGVKMANPDLSVWVITGDGDALSIGGNHFIHLMRRNFDLNVLLFNNRIYGLTKGQYSPTSEQGKQTYSTPLGSLEAPFNPISLALASGATFVARSLDRDPDHLRLIIKSAFEHKGTSFIEIYQNCNIFNDGTFFQYTEKDTKADNTVFLEHGEPLVFGGERNKGIRLNGFQPEVVETSNGHYTTDDLIVHDQYTEDTTLANFLAGMSDTPDMPHPIGIFRSVPASLLRRRNDQPNPHRKRADGRRRHRGTPQRRRNLDCVIASYYTLTRRGIDSPNRCLVTLMREYSTSVRSTAQAAV